MIPRQWRGSGYGRGKAVAIPRQWRGSGYERGKVGVIPRQWRDSGYEGGKVGVIPKQCENNMDSLVFPVEYLYIGIRKKADETVIILEPYTILFRICFWSRDFASNGRCLPPWAVVTVPY